MKRTVVVATFGLVVVAAPSLFASQLPTAMTLGPSLAFEENFGQADAPVRFLARTPGYQVFLTSHEIVLTLTAGDMPPGASTAHLLRLRWSPNAGASRAVGLDPMPARISYFKGDDPRQWLRDVPSFGKVRLEQVYPGVDLICYGNAGQLEYDLVLAPGVAPQSVILECEGADSATLDGAGDLVLRLGDHTIRQHSPEVFQVVNGERRRLLAACRLLPHPGTADRGVVAFTFEVPSFDPRLPLTIDPWLTYSTYLGGSGFDDGADIAVDFSGSAYITGWTSSVNFPVTAGAYQTELNGDSTIANTDAFVAKYDVNGALVFCTYLGGDGSDVGRGIALDVDGGPVITGGTTSTDFPTTPNALQDTLCGPDIFLAKLSPLGNALFFSTYFGGCQSDEALAVTVDTGGNAFITGYTTSPDFPATPGCFQPAMEGNSDAFVAKMSFNAPVVHFASYLGGDGEESKVGVGLARPCGIAIDDAQATVYVTGWTGSTDFPVTPGAMEPVFQGGDGFLGGTPCDAYLALVHATGTMLLYATYLGGAGNDAGCGIAVDALNRAYLTGYTSSVDFPVKNAFQPTLNGPLDAFVTRIDPFPLPPDQLTYSTYLGGLSLDAARACDLALDASDHVHVTGDTWSPNFPIVAPVLSGVTLKPDIDAYVATFDPDLSGAASLLFSTYLGGFGNDFGEGIAVLSVDVAFITGDTFSGTFPLQSPAQGFNAGGADAFVTRISGIPGGSGVGADPIAGRSGLAILPNPAGPSVRIVFTLAEVADTQVEIFDVSGRCLRTLAEGPIPAGMHELRWDGRTEDGGRAPAGLYFVRLRSAGVTSTRPMVWVQ